jgi:hypothetical protein
MRKGTLFVIAAALVLTCVAGWLALTPHATVAAPTGVWVDPVQMMMNANDLPAERYHDFSLVFD